MLDRESTFADPEIIKLLQTRVVPVAIDQAYQRRQKDAEGDFYRRIAGQGPRKSPNFQGTTQGLYVATAAGKLISYNNNRGADRIKRLLREALDEAPGPAKPIEPGKLDARYQPSSPSGGLVVRVQTKVLGGYEATDNSWRQIFQNALSRDNLWITREEHQALVAGRVPAVLQQRIARFHLVDNTRGEPPMWKEDEVREVQMSIRKDGLIEGRVELKSKSGDRGYSANLRGHLEVREQRVVRFDLVALGDFHGEGPYTRGAPPGKFPLGVSFRLADGSDVADAIPPQASRGWVRGYLQP